MHLEIVSAEGILFIGEVNSVTVPGAEGEFQLLEHHADIISILTLGNVKIRASIFVPNPDFLSRFSQDYDKRYILFINSGTVEVKNNKIIILIDS